MNKHEQLKKLAKVLKKARKDANLSQESLARKVDVSVSTIFKLEQGGDAPSAPSFLLVASIARELGLSLDSLFK